MGKSNKFDYTNRSNSGPKLGQIIGSALQKEAEKVQKDAERHLQKARKQSADSISASSDATTTTHVIDLKAPGKELEDAGVCALLDGLESALRTSTRQVALVLVDLDLSGNCITAASLARLAPILELACNDLKHLNLGNNNIKVETVQQAAEWDMFLQGFRGCSKLRTLNFSGNVELGHRALEILARVHTAEQHAMDPPLSRENSAPSTPYDSDVSEDDYSNVRVVDTDQLGNGQGSAVDDTSLQDHIRGLCSIPYLTLHNVGLDNAGALWLSYVLQDHLYPSQLNGESNGTQAESSTKTLSPDDTSQGIEWSENKTLGKEGRQLLEKTELLRRQSWLETEAASTKSENGSLGTVIGNGKEKRKSFDDKSLKLPQDQRRASVKSLRTSDSSEHDMHELESARKKVKRAIIAHDGATSVELWHSALNLVRTSRCLLYLAPSVREIDVGPAFFKRPDAVLSPASTSRCSDDGSVADGIQSLFIESYPKSQTTDSDNARVSSSTSKLVRPSHTGQSNGMLGDITNLLAKPKALPKTRERKDAFGEGNDLQTVNDKLNRLVVRNAYPLRFVRYQEQRISELAREGRYFRDIRIPCQLPIAIVERVSSFLTTDCNTSIMNAAQRRAAMDWGQRRETLMVEREWLRKDESAQVLMLLDSVACLAYT